MKDRALFDALCFIPGCSSGTHDIGELPGQRFHGPSTSGYYAMNDGGKKLWSNLESDHAIHHVSGVLHQLSDESFVRGQAFAKEDETNHSC